ncbi:hypothetical protein, partial [Desulfobacula sp.]|uniref:hypothetical protein n=1 Tax=Desulfobacula sp. TaxID=2593537 RepID=UPI00262C7AFC
ARHRACQHSPSSEGKVIWSERVWDIHKKLHAIALNRLTRRINCLNFFTSFDRSSALVFT